MSTLSLRTKGIIIILLFTFIPLIIVGLYNYTSVERVLFSREIENITLKQDSRSYIIESWLETRKAEVLVMSRTNEIRSGDSAQMKQYIRQEQALNSNKYSEIGFVSNSGQITSLTGNSSSFSQFFPIARSLRGNLFVADIVVEAEKDERLGYMSVPVYALEDSEEMIGALYVAYSFPPVTYAENLQIDGGNLYLYNYSGELLYQHLHADFTNEDEQVIRDELKQIAALALTKDSSYERITINNNNYLVFYQKVNNTNWVIIEVKNLQDVKELAAPTLWNMLFVVGIAILLIALVFFIYFQTLANRIKDIVKVTKKAAEGNFDAEHLDGSNKDEIGDLANTVNGMMSRLQIMFDRLDAVINQNKSPVLVMDERYVITYLNKAAEEMIGYTAEEIVGKCTPLLFLDMDEVREKAEQFSKEIGRKVQPGVELFLELRRYYSQYDFELTIVTRDQKRIPVYNRSSSLRDRSGKYSGIIAIFTDMSEQRELENINNRLQMVVESAKDAIAMVNQDAQFIYINEAGRKILGIGDIDISGVKLNDIIPDHMFRLLRRGSVTARKQGFFEYEAQFQNIAGKFINVSIIIVAYQDSLTGDTIYSCISRDITEQIEVQRKLVHATEVAEQANKAKSNFLALMSHEIRTPLNGIIGLSQLLQKTDLDSVQMDYLQHMKDSSNMLLNIVNDVLDFSKLEANKLEPDLTVFNIHIIINHLAEQLSVFLGGKVNFEFKIHIDRNIPVTMTGDALRLEQILTNLCVNAIKFTEQGLVELDILLNDEREDEIELQFIVKDTGIGMAEEQLKYLFKPFTQADSSTTRKYGGTGLGLVISKNLVELLGGSLKVESKLDVGSTFIFTLPFKKVDYHQPLEPIQAMNYDGSIVWIVEDHETMSNYWSDILTSYQMSTVKFDSWKKTLIRLLRLGSGAYPLFILMDMEMNDMYGTETWLEFQKEAACRNIPIIAITTAYGREELLMLEDELQPDAILTKPVIEKRFLEAIQQVLYEHENEVIAEGSDATTAEPLIVAKPQDQPQQTHNEQIANVLIAEDNKVNQFVAAEMLRHYNCNVTIANNGAEAVEFIEANDYDLVLMDIHMPVMDGLEATKKIRAQEKYRDLPIVAVTANVLASDHERYMLHGIQAVLSKPLSIDKLEEVIDQYTKRKKPLSNSSKQGTKATLEEAQEKMDKLNLLTTIEAQQAIERVSGKVNIYIHMLEQYFHDYSLFIAKINKWYEADDLDNILRALHTLKGASSYLGANSIVELAIEGERIIRQEQAKKFQTYIHQLEQELNHVLYEISTVIDSYHI